MAIDDLKRWHWCLIGAAAGLLAGLAQPAERPGPVRRSVEPARFEALLVEPDPGDPVRPIEHVRVYPRGGGRYCVEFDLLTEAAGQNWYAPHRTDVTTPYIASVDPPPNSSTDGRPYTIIDHLRRLRAKYPDRFSYTLEWWADPRWTCTLWTVGGLVSVGGIWPTVLAVLVGAGFGSKEHEQPYDLDRFGHDRQEGGPPSSRAAATPGGGAAVDAFNAQIENALSGQGPGDPPPVDPAPVGPPEIVPLHGEAMSCEVPRTVEPKDYDGEFYPTERVRPHHGERDG